MNVRVCQVSIYLRIDLFTTLLFCTLLFTNEKHVKKLNAKPRESIRITRIQLIKKFHKYRKGFDAKFFIIHRSSSMFSAYSQQFQSLGCFFYIIMLLFISCQLNFAKICFCKLFAKREKLSLFVSQECNQCPLHYPWTAEAQFIVPDWGNKVDFVLGLSYRPVRLHRLAGRHDNPSRLYPPERDYEFVYWVFHPFDLLCSGGEGQREKKKNRTICKCWR